jgi:hypothetical protein
MIDMAVWRIYYCSLILRENNGYLRPRNRDLTFKTKLQWYILREWRKILTGLFFSAQTFAHRWFTARD